MIEEMMWKLFEKTGRLDIYINYKVSGKIVDNRKDNNTK